ncbi:ISL3 family transposase [Gimesia maris]|uniref:Transposase n=2 Tax=Gimesia maris TaxID=122 RepID=A0ABX5YNN1_9PLAN|nr:ISL3 family transposase [Gimesia maris]QEG17286.1 Transposase [Gimesia maris]QGQ29617.1 ISL3 family transposase [Gimesia maris]
MPDFIVFPKIHGLKIQRMVQDENRFQIYLRAVNSRACCPECQKESDRVHSRYTRSPSDLPCFSQKTQLILQVRRFVCINQTCKRKIFTERLTDLIQPHARTTIRLSKIQQQIGLLLGGEPGKQLSSFLGMPCSADTLLRRIRTGSRSDYSPVRVLGVDDWALRRGQRYGTILCDLEIRQVIDLLPDRTSGSLADWLVSHPGVEIISRDRGGEYAKGASQGAPQAIQVVDRWHLLKNARETLQKVIDRHQKQVRESVKLLAERESKLSSNALHDSNPLNNSSTIPNTDNNSRKKKQIMYEQICELHQSGMSIRKMACQLRVGRRTVRRYLRTDAFPERATRSGTSCLDPHLDELKSMWDAGVTTATVLWRRLKELGFDGSYSIVNRKVAFWRKKLQISGDGKSILHNALPVSQPSSMCLSWLLWKPIDELARNEKKLVKELLQTPMIFQATQLIHEFHTFIQQQDSAGWDNWLERACSENAPIDIRRFGKSLKRDEEAVKAAMKSIWSNGQVEGQVNRLKMVKRQMYGRASFDLLRARFLNNA